MSVIEHLEALRRALIISAVAWAIATVIAWFFSSTVYELLLHRANIPRAYVFDPPGAFFLRLKVALYLGFVLSAPVIIQQGWWFVSPGLYLHERRLFAPLILATIFFFALGIGFALFSLPLIMRVLTGFASADVVYFPDATRLLGFILALVIGFGIVFELPVILWVLGRMGIISSRWLYKNHAYWIIGLGLLANILTPGADPLTPMIMFVPLLVFWEGTALLLKMTGR